MNEWMNAIMMPVNDNINAHSLITREIEKDWILCAVFTIVKILNTFLKGISAHNMFLKCSVLSFYYFVKK